jgi:anti-sigma regulatory factor (Ser/Thr protein kinase)
MAPAPTSSPIAPRGHRPGLRRATALPSARYGPREAASHRAVIALLAEERQVRMVRRFASAHLSCWGLTEQDRDCVVLIVGELAGNAARHGGTDMTVSLSLTDRDLCIDVVDTGPSDRPSRAHCSEAEDEHGRGLGIVDHLASAERDGWRSRAGLRVAPAGSAAA